MGAGERPSSVALADLEGSRSAPGLDRRQFLKVAGGAAALGLHSLRLHANVEWAEQESVRRALRQAGGVKQDAAELLGISQRVLSYYLGKYRIE